MSLSRTHRRPFWGETAPFEGPQLAKLLELHRNKDTVRCAAIGAEVPGIATFYIRNFARWFGNTKTMLLYAHRKEGRQQKPREKSTVWRCCFVRVHLFVLRKKIKPSKATFLSMQGRQEKKARISYRKDIIVAAGYGPAHLFVVP